MPKMTRQELLDLIHTSALSDDTRNDRQLQHIFNTFYATQSKRDTDYALCGLLNHLRCYQLEHAFNGPSFISKIQLEIQRPTPIQDTVRLGSLLNWFSNMN